MSLQKHCASYATTMVTTPLYKGMGLDGSTSTKGEIKYDEHNIFMVFLRHEL